MNNELSNPASREGYADDWEEPKRPHHAKPHQLDTQQTPPVVKRYQTVGRGPSAGIPKKDLELSKVEKAVEDIRLTLRGTADWKASEIRFQLSKIESATSYLKEH